MSVRHPLTLLNPAGIPQAGRSVELWTASDVSPFYQAPKIGDFTDNADGTYHIDIVSGVKGTVLVDSVVYESRKNVFFEGDDANIADGSITTAKLADGAVTLPKISASGASSGQVILYNGSSIVWAAGGGSGSGFDHSITGNSHSIDLDQFIHDINPQGYTAVPDVVLVQKSAWGCYVDFVDEDSIIVKPNPSGQGNTWDYDLFIISNG